MTSEINIRMCPSGSCTREAISAKLWRWPCNNYAPFGARNVFNLAPYMDECAVGCLSSFKTL